MRNHSRFCVLPYLLITVTHPAAAGQPLPSHSSNSLAATELSAPSKDDAKLRPIKKTVGRAVTSTMKKINNPWFVVSQILIPLAVILFSLMYVRRYRIKHAVRGASPNSPAEGVAGNGGNRYNKAALRSPTEPNEPAVEEKVQS